MRTWANDRRMVREFGMLRRAAAMAAMIAMLGMASCDSNGSTTAPADPRAVPGKVIGKLADQNGRPLKGVTIRISGFAQDGGRPVTREAVVTGPAGEYSMDLPDGAYAAPEAVIRVDYNNRTYVLPLASADGTKDWQESRDSKRGLVRDFVWRISGPRPAGHGNPLDPTGYWGEAVLFDLGGNFGDGPSFEITLTPDGPLIDGTEGKAMTFKRQLPWKRHEDHWLLDLPVGRYTATAKLMFGVKPKPLKLISYTVDPANADAVPDQTALTATVEFEQRAERDGKLKVMAPSLVVFP